MIDPKELRIGNWAGYEGEFFQVWSEITKYSVDLDNLTNRHIKAAAYDEISPIPLTPWILERAGFEEWAEGNWRTKPLLNLGGWSKEFNYYLPYYNFSTYTGNVIIKHIHQLQNLYFALSGEELEISLTKLS